MDITWGAGLAHEIPWEWMIAVYLFLAGVAGGAFLTAALTDLFSKQNREKIVRSGAYIAPISIIVGLLLLVVDLGKPLSFWKLLIYPNLNSVMSIGVYIVSAFSAFAVVYGALVWLDARAAQGIKRAPYGQKEGARFGDEIAASATAGNATFQGLQKFRKPIAAVGSLFAIGTATYTGFLLSDVSTNQLWHTPFLGMDSIPFLPFLFLVSALSAGLAATLMGGSSTKDLTVYKKTDMVLIVLEMILLTILYTSVAPIFFSGSMSMLFWLGVVTVGLIIPLVITIYALMKHKNIVLPVSVLVVIGGLSLRFWVVYSGQMFN
jgi:polysulfide reductase chain C